MADQYKRDYYERRRSAMKAERSSFISHYQELAEFIQPRRGRFFPTDRNRGDRRWNSIINSHATQALRVATSGLFSGVMSPTRPWHRLTLEDDPDLMEYGPVKQWLWLVEEQQRSIFSGSNLYNMAPVMLQELLLFSVGCMSHVDDFEDVARFYTHTVGNYMISQDEGFRVNTVAREQEMTVEQIIGKFSPAPRDINPSISAMVRQQYDKGNYDAWYPIVHFVDPNPERSDGSQNPMKRDFRGVYYEPGHLDKDVVLEEKFFFEFPFYCPRWDVTEEDIYGTNGPGMTALGDVRGLQLEERRKAQGIDKMVSPALHGPPSLRNVPINNMPGQTTIYEPGGTQHYLRPVHEIDLRLQELMQDIEKVERRIDKAFYVDLFMAISEMPGIQPRNQLELTQRNQERLIQLGYPLERMFGEFLSPMIARTLGQQWRAKIIPPPPKEIQGRPLKIKYVSSLAMAQQSVTTGNIDRLSSFVAGLVGAGFTGAADKFDADQAVDEYAALIGAPPKLVVPDNIVAAQRQQRQQMQQAAQMAEIAKTGAEAASAVGGMSMEGTVAGKMQEAMDSQNV